MSQEDFDLASLASYLQITPEQLKKMANRDQIPGRRIGGDWRFSKAAIHHWMEDKIGSSDDSQLVNVEKLLDLDLSVEEPDSISGLMVEAAIAVPLSARTRSSVIAKMCELAVNAGVLWDPDKMADAIRSREQLHPTALGNGVALLHSRRPLPSIIGQPFLALGITSSGIPFGGPRGVLTDVFFLIGSTDEGQHLRTLARLSRILQRPDFLNSLRASPSGAAAIELIVNCADEFEE